jgi:hypothetical protein
MRTLTPPLHGSAAIRASHGCARRWPAASTARRDPALRPPRGRIAEVGAAFAFLAAAQRCFVAAMIRARPPGSGGASP